MTQPPQGTPARHGLKTWHSPPSPNVDICFIHGLLGDRDQTWTSETAERPWPEEFLAQSFENARILTYGYDSDTTPLGSGSNGTLSTLANDLNWSLVESRISSECRGIPIIFIAHGLGGLICKRAIQSSFQSSTALAQEVSSCLLGIVFMGTPHIEPVLADTFRSLETGPSRSAATSRFLDSLGGNGETPTLLHDVFIQTITSIDPRTNIFCYFETKPLSNSQQLVVSFDSAILPQYGSQSITSSHLDMTKFDSEDDPSFNSLCTVLRSFTTSDRAQAFSSLSLSGEAPRQPPDFKHLASPRGSDIKRQVQQPFSGPSSANFYQRSILNSEHHTVPGAQHYPEIHTHLEPSLPETFQVNTVDDQDLAVQSPKQPPRSITPEASISPGQKVSDGIAHLHFDVNPQLVGRDDIARKLRNCFFRKKLCSVALCGLGGAGLTQVANDFAHWVKRSRPEYSVIWLPAISRASFARAYTELATALGVNMRRRSDLLNKLRIRNGTLIKVRDYINSDKHRPYLIILDDAHDPNLICGSLITDPLSRYLPKGAHVQILVTSRSFSVAKSLAEEHIEVNPLAPEQALVMARHLLVRKWHSLASDDAITNALLQELQFLPLAISQAMACMDRENIAADKYLEGVRGSDSALQDLVLEEQPDSNRYEESTHDISSTWLSSLEYILQIYPLAAELLELLSQLYREAVPVSLLPSRLAGSNTIDTLKKFNFVSQHSTNLFTHGLVHTAAANWVDKRGRSKLARDIAIHQISSVYRSYPTVQNEHKWAHLLPHAKHVVDRIESVASPEEMDLCTMLFFSLSVRKNFKDAVRYGELGQNYSSYYRSEHTEPRLQFEEALALAYQNDKQFSKALEYYKHVVKIRQDTLPKTDNSRLRAERELASTYREDDQLQKAIHLLQHVVETEQTILSENDHRLLYSQHELAMAYRQNGQFQKAIQLLEHVVEIEQNILSESDPNRLISQNQLAVTYRADGQFQKAIHLLEHIIEIYRNTVPKTDVDFLISQTEYSACLESVGRGREAKEIARNVVVVIEEYVTPPRDLESWLHFFKSKYPDA